MQDRRSQSRAVIQGTDSETGGIATTTGEQMMVGMESSAEECECLFIRTKDKGLHG